MSKFVNESTGRRTIDVTPSGGNVAIDVDYLLGFRVGGAGDVGYTDESGAAGVFKNISNGEQIPVILQEIVASTTTATNIIAIYRTL